jgi:hypothetical protein
VETAINWIAVKRDGNFALIRQNELDNFYLGLFKQKLTPIFHQVITNLKKQKEHLALQLNFEFGNISEVEFDKEEKKYLDEPKKIPIQELKQNIDILYTFSKVDMDSEEISEAFDCQIDTAEEALQLLLFEDKPNARVRT